MSRLHALPAAFLGLVLLARPSSPPPAPARRSARPLTSTLANGGSTAPLAARARAARHLPAAQPPVRTSFDGATREEVLRAIASLLDLATAAFDQRRYVRCIALCDRTLALAPHYPVAMELKEDARKCLRKEEYRAILKRKLEAMDCIRDEDRLPWAATVADWHFMDPDYLAEIVTGALDAGSADEDGDISAPKSEDGHDETGGPCRVLALSGGPA